MLQLKRMACAMIFVLYFVASPIALSIKRSPQHENLFIEVTEDMQAMTKMEIYTHEIRVVKRIIKDNVVGHISNPMWLDSRRLRDVPDNVVLSKQELWEHRNEVIMFVQKTDRMIKKRMNRVMAQAGSITGSIGVFVFGLIDGIFGRRAWTTWNDDPSNKCLTMTGATLKDAADLNDAKKEMDKNMGYFQKHVENAATTVKEAVSCKTDDCKSLLEVGSRDSWGLSDLWSDVEDAASYVGDEASKVYEDTSDMVSEVTEVVSDVTGDVAKAANYVVTKTEDAVTYAAKKVYKAAKTVVKAEITAVKEVAQLAETAVEDGVGLVLGPEAKKDLTAAINNFNKIIEAGWNWLKNKLKNFLSALSNIIKSFQHNIKLLGEKLVNLIISKTGQKLCHFNRPTKRIRAYEALRKYSDSEGTIGYVLHNAVGSTTALVHCSCKETLRNLFGSKKVQTMYSEAATKENFDLLANAEYNYWMNVHEIMPGTCGGTIKAFVAPWSKRLVHKYFEAWTNYTKSNNAEVSFTDNVAKINQKIWKKLTSANMHGTAGLCHFVSDLINLIPSYLKSVAIQAGVMMVGPAGWIEAGVKVALGVAEVIGEAGEFKETQDIKTEAHNKVSKKTCDESGCPFFGQIEDCQSCKNTVTYQWGTQVGLVVEAIFTSKNILHEFKKKGHGELAEKQKSKIKEAKKRQRDTKLKPKEKRSKPKTITEKYSANSKKRIQKGHEPLTFDEYKKKHDQMMANRRKANEKTYDQYQKEKSQNGGKVLSKEEWQRKIDTLTKNTPLRNNIIKEISQLPRNAYVALKSCVNDMTSEESIFHQLHETLDKIEKTKLVTEMINGILPASADGIDDDRFESTVRNVFLAYDFGGDTSHNTKNTIHMRDYTTPVCEPSCPNAETLTECFGKDYKFYQKKISKLYGHENHASLGDNIDLLKLWQKCPVPKHPGANVRCSGMNGNCIDTRYDLCDGKILKGECPGSENIQCCPDNMFENIQPLMNTAEDIFESKTGKSGLQKNSNNVAKNLRKPVNTHIIKRHSTVPCYIGVPASYGCKDKNTLWVSNGCRADFNCAGETVNCESWGYGNTECRCKSCKISNVELTKTISRSECIKGKTYGCWSKHEMWVFNGCRGEFQCDGKSITCESKGYNMKKCKCDNCIKR